jgi:hypothetical protein
MARVLTCATGRVQLFAAGRGRLLAGRVAFGGLDLRCVIWVSGRVAE